MAGLFPFFKIDNVQLIWRMHVHIRTMQNSKRNKKLQVESAGDRPLIGDGRTGLVCWTIVSVCKCGLPHREGDASVASPSPPSCFSAGPKPPAAAFRASSAARSRPPPLPPRSTWCERGAEGCISLHTQQATTQGVGGKGGEVPLSSCLGRRDLSHRPPGPLSHSPVSKIPRADHKRPTASQGSQAPVPCTCTLRACRRSHHQVHFRKGGRIGGAGEGDEGGTPSSDDVPASIAREGG
jgi:hypothetical protein